MFSAATVIRLDDFDDQLDQRGRREELTPTLPLSTGKVAEEVFVNLPERVPLGIDGDNIVGYYKDGSNVQHGFKYDGSSYTALDATSLGATNTYAFGIDGSNIVGYYGDSNWALHGFKATAVPLPQAAWMALTMLGGIGGYGLIRRRLCSVNTPL